MKNFFLSILVIIFFGCAGNSNNNTAPDSVNGIEDHPSEDTQVAPRPDGYATPNAKTDTSQNIKDSLDTIKH